MRLLLLVLAGAALHAQSQTLTFEVASVKTLPPADYSKPAALPRCSGGPGTTDPGLFVCSNIGIHGLLLQAFDLAPYQFPYAFTAERIGFDIQAKVPVRTTPEQFRKMLQNLLVERFRLAYHFEKKPSATYDMIVAKAGPELHESQPASTGKPLPAPGALRDEYGMRNPPSDYQGELVSHSADVARLLERGVTMPRLARDLATLLKRPVKDSTGLAGQYDFTLYCSAESVGLVPPESVSGPAATKVSKAGEQAAEGVHLPSILAVIRDKLGLQLVPKRGFYDQLVIDHVEKAPSEN
jgi:uncharacterized protein (TIGR03435 family)